MGDHTKFNGSAALALGIISAMIMGCQGYQPRPLDPAAHAAAWQARSPSDRAVREFMECLEHTGRAERREVRFDPQKRLTLEEAELFALVFNADLRLARLRAGVARASAEHAGLWEDPVLQIDVLRILEGVANPWVISPGLTFTIPLSGRLEADRRTASAALRVELVRVAEAEWAIRRDVRRLWAQLSAVRFRLEESQRLLGSLDQLVDASAILIDAGELLRTEASLFSIERAQQRQDLQRLDMEERMLSLQLRQTMGLAPGAPIELVDLRLVALAETPVSDDGLPVHSLALLRLQEEYQGAEASLQREVARQYPDLSIGPRYDSDQGQSRLGIFGGLPIPLFNRNRRGIAEAVAERESARGAYEVEIERIVSELAALGDRIDALRAQRCAMETALVPMVDRQLADARRLLETGEAGPGGPLVLLDSLRQAHAVKMNLLQLRLDEALAEIERAHLLGPPRTAPQALDTTLEALP